MIQRSNDGEEEEVKIIDFAKVLERDNTQITAAIPTCSKVLCSMLKVGIRKR